MSAIVRSITAVALVVTAIAVFRPTSVKAQGNPTVNQRLAALETQVAALQGQVATLLTTVAALQGNINAEAAARATADTALQTQINSVPTVPQNVLDLANYISVDLNTVNNLAGPHVVFTGANVHIQNGLADTQTTNGLGNFIVGYNEPNTDWPRNGSHNVVVGPYHGYSAYGGLVVGSQNTISGIFASVTAGLGNAATGMFSSVSGGANNAATSIGASVSGGQLNGAHGSGASVSGGYDNRANGHFSTVSGGENNRANNNKSTVSGGGGNIAGGQWSAISGGNANSTIESAEYSTVSGGQSNVADTVYSHLP